MLEPHEDVEGVPRYENDLLSLDEKAREHRRIIVAVAEQFYSACLSASLRPSKYEKLFNRITHPQIGDLVYEESAGVHGPYSGYRDFGYLIEERTEWASIEEDWENEVDNEEEAMKKAGIGFDRKAFELERPVEHVWYIQYGQAPEDVCRWYNCRFIMIPTELRT